MDTDVSVINKAENEADIIAKLLDQNKGFNRVSHRPALEGVGIIRPVTEYEAFGSRSSAFNGIMAALEDDNVNIIGVYGMGGVGKTTLVKEIARETKENQLFDEVVLVAITQTSNTKLTKVLIILDDIWEEEDLGALGILPTDEHKGLKMLMTSWKLVLLKLMGSQKSLPIDILKEDEACKLFKNVTAPIGERAEFQYTAKKVAQKCEGLPIAIATVAKALKYKENLCEWEDALEQLKPSEINFRGISGAVYSAIEMSYKYLEREELKIHFLALLGLGLFRDLDTIEKVLNRVLTVASELKDSSLLLANSTPECCDMDDVVCDVAISIASRDHSWLSLGKENVFEGWSDEESMRNYRLISVQKTKVSELPDELECPNLNFFSMGSADYSLKVPNNLFKGHRCLDIDILGVFVNLEILVLRSSGIRVLPKEIGQ
ncbi:disease resistance protein At4g27190-like [Gossypium hirsutum]|uniref:Disease resistance protein At4g27190-like n=1 Tax=Gossypium hirsutum TaxID=3635 RepID=A0A1U8PCL6_GOSHI|nr:disease resistance protein At4g27190-like [Gossypium hirsutum]